VLISLEYTKKNIDFASFYEQSKKKAQKRGRNEQKTANRENIFVNESQ
tara:strand:+ start:532 stop:675 length:144 start_codon:yes stop_codon:yes gene_type:complete